MSCIASIQEFEQYVKNENYKTIYSLNCFCFELYCMKNRTHYLEGCVCRL